MHSMLIHLTYLDDSGQSFYQLLEVDPGWRTLGTLKLKIHSKFNEFPPANRQVLTLNGSELIDDNQPLYNVGFTDVTFNFVRVTKLPPGND